jgi:hypothetical protein
MMAAIAYLGLLDELDMLGGKKSKNRSGKAKKYSVKLIKQMERRGLV